MTLVLSHFQAAELLRARQSGHHSATCSPDLNLSRAEVKLDEAGVTFAHGERIAWPLIERIAAHANACFRVDGDALTPIQSYSDEFERAYSLFPAESAPTMLVSGKPMHRIKGTNPHADTLSKIRAVGPIRGDVLDTCTGLGYTAIEAAKTARSVTTVELDPTAQAIARANPWSRELFDNPRIAQLIGDSAELIAEFEAAHFGVIVHDPPMFSLGGELYSLAFYRECARVLKPNGKMFHYIGNPDSSSGATVTRGVIRRLREAGFGRIVEKPQAFGVLAQRV